MESKQIYNIHNLFCLELVEHGRSCGLPELLAGLRTERLKEPRVKLTIVNRSHQLPRRSDAVFAGRYKGIPWRLLCNRDSAGHPAEIHFYAPCFRLFLGVRLALIPLVRQLALERGGFGLLGTAFRWRGVTWHLYGRPGTGKTKLLIEALEDGGELVGDFELVASSDGTLHPLIDRVEFRYATVRHTPYWRHLTGPQRRWLQMCRLISFLTGRWTSFNLVMAPGQLGCPVAKDKAEAKHTLVGIGFDQKEWNAEGATRELMGYYHWYESIYGVVLNGDTGARDRQLTANVRRYVSRCDLLALPVGRGLQGLQSAESRR
ncbi:MAG: hypothetical protein U0V70_01705 [Terriglobia bacterium]